MSAELNFSGPPSAQARAPGLRAWLTLLALPTITAATMALAAESVPSPTAAHSLELWPAPAHVVDRDAVTEANIDQLLARMTPEEKVGQMIQADIASITPEDLLTYRLGSILAGGGAAPGADVRTSPQAWRDLADAFHRASVASGAAVHPPIPVLFGIDAVHGHAKVIGATIFPHNVALGAAHDPELIRRIGAATAEEVAATGIDWTFAPTVAVVRDVRWGRSYESYSEDPALVARYASAMVTGLQGAPGSPEFLGAGHTLSSVKHFLGDGGTVDGRDQGDVLVSESVLSRVHGAGYPPAIAAGAMIVMASYNSWHGLKSHANHYLLSEVLKGRLGFDGFVVGDWNAQEQIPGCTKFSCPEAILAGVDMLMAPDSWKSLYRNTLAQLRSGEIPQARVDEAVRRILRVKARAGLLGEGAGAHRADSAKLDSLGSAGHRALAREAVRRSLVLLKNNHGILPLNPKSSVLVAGSAADDIGVQSGGWTIDWQGDHNSNADFPGATSIFAGIKAAVGSAGGSATLSVAGTFSAKPDVAIVVFGEGPYAEFEGDRETLEYSPGDRHDLALLQRLHAQGVPVVTLFLSGRPMWVNRELNASDAFVAAWLPGSEGAGIADVLFRAADGSIPHDFTGRLGFSWPRTAMPVSYDAADRPRQALFARGYGLDYSHAAHVARLPEDPHVPARLRQAGALYADGHVTAPWSLFVADAGGDVHVTTAAQRSPLGAIGVSTGSGGAVATWSGARGGVLKITGRPSEFITQAAAGAALALHFRVLQAPSQPVLLGLRCAAPYLRHPVATAPGAPTTPSPTLCGTAEGAMLDVTDRFKGAAVGAWRDIAIPLSCLAANGADLGDVEAPFSLETTGEFALALTDIRIVPRTGPAVCPQR
jgi:beta-glucosidase